MILRTLEAQERVIRIFAVDDDKDDNAVVTYSIFVEDATCPACFNMDPTTGWIVRGTGTLPPVRYICISV